MLLKVGNDVSTDGIIPPGTRLPYWSNIPTVAEFAFEGIAPNRTSKKGIHAPRSVHLTRPSSSRARANISANPPAAALSANGTSTPR